MGKIEDNKERKRRNILNAAREVFLAEGFIRWHLEEEPLQVYRLLVSGSGRSPEIVKVFFTIAPDETRIALGRFFTERLGVTEPADAIRLWTSMLLAFRDDAAPGMRRPQEAEIDRHARMATRFLMAGLR